MFPKDVENTLGINDTTLAYLPLLLAFKALHWRILHVPSTYSSAAMVVLCLAAIPGAGSGLGVDYSPLQRTQRALLLEDAFPIPLLSVGARAIPGNEMVLVGYGGYSTCLLEYLPCVQA